MYEIDDKKLVLHYLGNPSDVLETSIPSVMHLSVRKNSTMRFIFDYLEEQVCLFEEQTVVLVAFEIDNIQKYVEIRTENCR